MIVWPNGFKENAGMLADNFRRDPPDQFPGLEDRRGHDELTRFIPGWAPPAH